MNFACSTNTLTDYKSFCSMLVAPDGLYLIFLSFYKVIRHQLSYIQLNNAQLFYAYACPPHPPYANILTYLAHRQTTSSNLSFVAEYLILSTSIFLQMSNTSNKCSRCLKNAKTSIWLSYVLIINVNGPINILTAKWYKLTPWQFIASGDWSTSDNIKKRRLEQYEKHNSKKTLVLYKDSDNELK